MARAERRRRRLDDARVQTSTRLRVVPWVLYLLTLASAYPVGAILAATHPQPPDTCSGIGFGCSPYGWDAVGFLFVFLGIPFAIGLAFVLAVLTLLPDRVARAATPVAAVGLVVPWAFMAWAVATTAR